jgi:hypothetical protein
MRRQVHDVLFVLFEHITRADRRNLVDGSSRRAVMLAAPYRCPRGTSGETCAGCAGTVVSHSFYLPLLLIMLSLIIVEGSEASSAVGHS